MSCVLHQDSYEIERLKREKNGFELELTRLKANTDTEKRKTEKLERELSIANEKSDKAQRELIAAEREKRRLEEDKRKDDASLSKLVSVGYFNQCLGAHICPSFVRILVMRIL